MLYRSQKILLVLAATLLCTTHLQGQFIDLEGGFMYVQTLTSPKTDNIYNNINRNPFFQASYEQSISKKISLTIGYAQYVPTIGMSLQLRYQNHLYEYAESVTLCRDAFLGIVYKKPLNKRISICLSLLFRGSYIQDLRFTGIGGTFPDEQFGTSSYGVNRVNFLVNPKVSLQYHIAKKIKTYIFCGYMQGFSDIAIMEFIYRYKQDEVVGKNVIKGSNLNFGIGIAFNPLILNE